ncbi:MAG: TrmH family RNA methyltransferase [Oligoflexales bacterium]
MRPPSSRNREQKQSKADGIFAVVGWASIKEYVANCPERIEKIVCNPTIIAQLKIDVKAVTNIKLSVIEDVAENSICAYVRLEAKAEDDFFVAIKTRTPSIIVALDHVMDPHNLGAIVRTCAFFGVTDVIAPKDRQVLLSPASVKVSQGGFSRTSLWAVTNLGRVVRELKKQGYWIVGTHVDSESFEKIPKKLDRVVVLMGSEEKGLSQGLLKECDFRATIFSGKQKLESLNVSVAAGIFLHYFCELY